MKCEQCGKKRPEKVFWQRFCKPACRAKAGRERRKAEKKSNQ